MIIAHRGASADAPENTLAAFEKAVEDGADMIELDVRLCAGGQTVVFHDEDLHRLAGIPGKISGLTLDELRAVDLAGQKIPTLEEVLGSFSRRISINIEIKDPGAAESAAGMLSRCPAEASGGYPDFLVSSFDQETLRAFHKYQPEIRLGWVVCRPDPDYSKLKKDVELYSIHQHIDCVSGEWVRGVREAGLKAMVYTVNHKADILRMKSLNVDGIFTDFPDKARAAVKT